MQFQCLRKLESPYILPRAKREGELLRIKPGKFIISLFTLAGVITQGETLFPQGKKGTAAFFFFNLLE